MPSRHDPDTPWSHSSSIFHACNTEYHSFLYLMLVCSARQTKPYVFPELEQGYRLTRCQFFPSLCLFRSLSSLQTCFSCCPHVSAHTIYKHKKPSLRTTNKITRMLPGMTSNSLLLTIGPIAMSARQFKSYTGTPKIGCIEIGKSDKI